MEPSDLHSVSTPESTLTTTSTIPVPPLDCDIKFDQSFYEGFRIEVGDTNYPSKLCGKVSINYNEDCYPMGSYSIKEAYPKFATDFIKIDSTSGELYCRQIYSENNHDEEIILVVRYQITSLEGQIFTGNRLQCSFSA